LPCLVDEALNAETQKAAVPFYRTPVDGHADCTTAVSIFVGGAILVSLIRIRMRSA
jgi:hypothetical protein